MNAKSLSVEDISSQPSAASAEATLGRGARYTTVALRILLGLLLLLTGLNGLLNFLPQPTTPLPEGATGFVTALVKTGYMLQLIAITQLVVGVFLVTNRFVALALVLLAPFMVNSLAFHIFLEHSGLPMALGVVAIQLWLVWVHRKAYQPLLRARSV